MKIKNILLDKQYLCAGSKVFIYQHYFTWVKLISCFFDSWSVVYQDSPLSTPANTVVESWIGYSTFPRERLSQTASRIGKKLFRWSISVWDSCLYEASIKSVRSLVHSIFCLLCRYTLQASTFQMAVLLQFNNAVSWTVGHLQVGLNKYSFGIWVFFF